MVISAKAPDGLGKLLAAGLSIWIVMEAVFNMAGMVGLLPFAGNALPFISAGGSSLVITMAAIGILMNISRMANKAESEAKRPNNAAINMRWRNRGRGLSRSRSSKRA
jgi:cell division protein FtsW